MDEEKPYKHLTPHFFKCSMKGQINSIWKKRISQERIDDYKQALALGHCKLGTLTPLLYRRLLQMGITIPETLKPVEKHVVRLTQKQVDRLQTFGVVCPQEMLPLAKKTIEEPPKPPEPPATETPAPPEPPQTT